PLASLGALATFEVGRTVMHRFPNKGAPTVPAMVGFAVIAGFWIASRLEHRLGETSVYRWIRHVWRLVMGAVGYYFLVGGPVQSPLQAAQDLLTLLARNRVDDVALLVALVGIHVLLTRRTLRTFWHRTLASIYLRPRGLTSDGSAAGVHDDAPFSTEPA